MGYSARMQNVRGAQKRTDEIKMFEYNSLKIKINAKVIHEVRKFQIWNKNQIGCGQY